MVDIVSGIAATVAVIISDVFATGLIMLQVHLYAKKRWNKNVKTYPYFSYPAHKKIFLLGLKGALSSGATILTILQHIVTILSIAFCVWLCVSQNEIIFYCSRIICGIALLLFLLRCGWQWASPPNL